MMKFSEIIEKLFELGKKHNSIEEKGMNEIKEAELIEQEAFHLILQYCDEQGYSVDGFPHEKRNLPEEEIDEDYFCHDRFRLFLDILTLDNNDVAELMWAYVSAFWPNVAETKHEYIKMIK